MGRRYNPANVDWSIRGATWRLTKVREYRTISKLNIIPKIHESIILEKVSPLTDSKIFIQLHGFVNGKSTVTNLTIYPQFLTNALENVK